MALLNGRPKCSLQITTEALLSSFYPLENSDQKSQIFIYELISLNESLFTKIYMYTYTHMYKYYKYFG